MTITYTTPIANNATTSKRLVNFSANIPDHRIVCTFDLGYIDGGGNFVKQSASQRFFTDDSTPSFNQFITNCPAAGLLRKQVEQYEVTLDRPGSVD